ncbi:hypothetical protein FKM82_009670 [Ascaphus truei]
METRPEEMDRRAGTYSVHTHRSPVAPAPPPLRPLLCGGGYGPSARATPRHRHSPRASNPGLHHFPKGKLASLRRQKGGGTHGLRDVAPSPSSQ